MKKVGVVGLGIMGLGIANNLIKNGFDVYAFNRSSAKYDLLEGSFNVCKNPKELADNINVVFDVTADDDSSNQVWFGENSLSMSENEFIGCLSSTLSLDYISNIKNRVQNNIKLVDAPLTGSRAGAETGNLTLLLGGEEKIIDSLKTVFNAISSKQINFGNFGNGTRFKLILNQLQAFHFAAMANSLTQAENVGLDKNQVAQALMGLGPSSPAGSLVIKELEGGYDQVQFGLGMLTKDLLYADTSLPSNHLTKSLLAAFQTASKQSSQSYSDVNCTEIYKYFLGENNE